MSMTHDAGQLHELTVDECWELAASQPIGRLAWTGTEGPTVVPVNFTVLVAGDRQTVVLRTAAYSSIARECDDSTVAFEVDAFDPETHTGWSVLIRGRAHIDFDEHEAPEAEVWPAGARALHLTLEVQHVTGRRVEPA